MVSLASVDATVPLMAATVAVASPVSPVSLVSHQQLLQREQHRRHPTKSNPKIQYIKETIRSRVERQLGVSDWRFNSPFTK